MKTPYHEESRLASGALMRMLALVLLVLLLVPTARAQVAEQDSLALVALYNATDGPNWVLNENWLTGPVSTWTGILINSNNRVSWLDLTENNLSGVIPPEIAQLTELVQIDLYDNNLTGPIPPELGQFSKLESLDLSRNQLTGSIPPELGQLTALLILNLSNNNLTGSIPSELGQLSLLRRLDLASNNLSGEIPAALGNLTEELDYINLSNNQLTGSIPAELGQISHLQALFLSGNQITGSIPPELGDLGGLEALELQENQLTGSIPSELGNLPFLFILDLSWNDLSGPIPSELGDLTSLQILNLSTNRFSGSIPPELGNLANLSFLYLDDNLFDGTLPPELGNLINLRTLFLFYNGFEGSIPLSFTNLAFLSDFQYFETSLCEPDDPDFRAWLENIPHVEGTGETCASSDNTPPECELVEAVKNSHIKVRVQDPESGIKEIKIIKSTNATVTTSDHLPFTTSPVYVTATKIQPKKASVLELEVTDVAGNVTRCDPVLTTLAAEVPSTFALEGNYPNPFNPSTTIRFQIAEPVHVTLTVYDVMGRTVARLVDQEMAAGSYAAEWDGKSNAGLIVAGGIYFYRLEAGSFVETRAMSLVK